MYTEAMSPIRTRLIQMGLTQERVAVALGIDPSLLGRYLRGIRSMPEGMEARINAALDLLEEEKRAAAWAVEKRAAAWAVEKRAAAWAVAGRDEMTVMSDNRILRLVQVLERVKPVALHPLQDDRAR